MRLIPAAATNAAIAPPATAAAARPPRKNQGGARWSGGGSNTCCSIATSISASSQPRSAASASAAPRTSTVSVQRKAAISRKPAPSAAMVANSCRRSASATATKSAIAAAASTSAKVSSIRLIPPRSTVVIELTVCAAAEEVGIAQARPARERVGIDPEDVLQVGSDVCVAAIECRRPGDAGQLRDPLLERVSPDCAGRGGGDDVGAEGQLRIDPCLLVVSRSEQAEVDAEGEQQASHQQPAVDRSAAAARACQQKTAPGARATAARPAGE